MAIKRYLITLGSVALFVFLFVLFQLNRELLLSPFRFTPNRWIPVWGVFLVFGVALILLPFILNLIQDVRGLPTVWSSWRRRKTDEEMDRKFARAMEEAGSGHDEDALTLLQSILDRDPEHFPSVLAAGDLLRALDRPSEAIDLHKRGSRLRPEDPRPLSGLASDYEAAGDRPRALAVLGEMVTRFPRHALGPYRRMRGMCVQQGDWEKAWEVQERVEELERKGGPADPDGPEFSRGIRYELALERKRRGRLREAENLLRRIVREAADFAPAHLEIGRILAGQGKGSEALRLWKAGFAASGSPVFLQAIQDLHLELDEPDAAIDTFREIGQQGRFPLLCRLFLGKLHENLEMVDQALEDFLALEEDLPNSPIVLRHLARLLERRGKHREAAARYAQLLAEGKPAAADYRCRRCQAPSTEWRDRCESCGFWGSLVFPIGEGRGTGDPGFSRAPVYSAG
ncbi:MAG: tetratricopeptide repeat protein [Acidobacteria bacterium]|nr:tetratricopeptide repeat protein [Acidobacteriota bacterium]